MIIEFLIDRLGLNAATFMVVALAFGLIFLGVTLLEKTLEKVFPNKVVTTEVGTFNYPNKYSWLKVILLVGLILPWMFFCFEVIQYIPGYELLEELRKN